MTALLAVWKMSLWTVRPDLVHCLSARRLSLGFKKLRADKTKPRGWRAVRDQTGGSRGVLIKQISEGLMKTVSRRRWS